MDLELPAGFTDLLQEFTIQVLQDKPDDIVEFAANYFMKLKLKEKRSKDGTKRKGKGVSFQSEEVNGDENSDDEDDEEMGIKTLLYFWFSRLSLQTSRRSRYLRKKFKNPPGIHFISFLPFSALPKSDVIICSFIIICLLFVTASKTIVLAFNFYVNLRAVREFYTGQGSCWYDYVEREL